MVIGSGPIVIGQAAEFDYAGTQACRALKEEGLEVVLINSNPATIMTDPGMADHIYVEPLTLDFVTRIIRKERPDGLLATLGGQTALNLAMELEEEGILRQYGVRLFGNETRCHPNGGRPRGVEQSMQQLQQPIPDSVTVNRVEDAVAFARVGYPVVVRPAFTLGGNRRRHRRGSGRLNRYRHQRFTAQPDWTVPHRAEYPRLKEIEFEVIRDSADHCIAVCSMENIDPVGVHTGDSIVVVLA